MQQLNFNHSDTPVQVTEDDDEYNEIIVELQRSRSRGSIRRSSGASHKHKSGSGSVTSSTIFSTSRRKTRMSSGRTSSSGDSLISSKSSKGKAAAGLMRIPVYNNHNMAFI